MVNSIYGGIRISAVYYEYCCTGRSGFGVRCCNVISVTMPPTSLITWESTRQRTIENLNYHSVSLSVFLFGSFSVSPFCFLSSPFYCIFLVWVIFIFFVFASFFALTALCFSFFSLSLCLSLPSICFHGYRKLTKY